MNDTSAAAGNAASSASTSSTLDTASLLTSVHLIWLAVFALVVVLGILYGARVKARQRDAERQVEEHTREAGVAPHAGGQEAVGQEEAPAPPPSPAAAPSDAIADGTGDAANGSVAQLKGLGPKVAARLADLGITTVGQLAALDDDAAHALDDQLGPFRGRLERDRWIEQARFLAAGDRAGFEAVFGRL